MMLVAMVFCIIFGTDIGMAAGVPLGNTGTQTATAPNGAEGVGIHNTDEPISLDQSRRDTDFLVLSELDREVVKILPYKSPLDTMLRYAKKRKTNSIVVEWVSVDSKPFESVTTKAWVLPEVPALDNAVNVEITVQNPSVFAKTSTILVPGISGYNEAGVATPKNTIDALCEEERRSETYRTSGEWRGDCQCESSLCSQYPIGYRVETYGSCCSGKKTFKRNRVL